MPTMAASAHVISGYKQSNQYIMCVKPNIRVRLTEANPREIIYIHDLWFYPMVLFLCLATGT